ncbi:MAG: tetratricopeptide repeat protein [Acidobacteriota bacterium]
MNVPKPFAALFTLLLLIGIAAGQQSKRDEGIDLYREGKFADAVRSLDEAVKADKGDRQAWLYLGAAYEHIGKHGDAQKALWNSRIIQKTNLPKYDKQAKITSKAQPDFRSSGNIPPGKMTFVVAVELGSDGKVGVVIPFQAPPHDYDGVVIDAAKKIVFEPAVKAGKPVSVIQVLEYQFNRY